MTCRAEAADRVVAAGEAEAEVKAEVVIAVKAAEVVEEAGSAAARTTPLGGSPTLTGGRGKGDPSLLLHV